MTDNFALGPAFELVAVLPVVESICSTRQIIAWHELQNLDSVVEGT
jgi:hypothetical protein